ncbi:30S ribosomal protein S4 [Caldivirga maquilingensis]|uniref:Small ribosomal subunit protein uS4 n=1 Tax=Caldivirga maquilingensis (strain ATCC 700844 / DSM 13496 / JCM 10307 / IC-167) TaxID=397948 RepID=RS4_CALMQ|nr:30S ribosomal protein S4 [Caldivirga maquilingensis]A8MDS5.1 RecName: Full=Small ribosomal subunit protein uS4; AltName: Full=30S ribosomal protein S4 [Caldivirga maquilingensis IC-167]ABW01931.1 ribosomal protein S4 [Caldivirga maquilingensis IC-167]
MGDPKRPKKKYVEGKPKRLWNSDLLMSELRLIGEYGLRNKKELWLARALLRSIKHRAREILSAPMEIRGEAEKRLKDRLFRMGLISDINIPLDSVLALDVTAVLERRLQTLVYRKGMARSIHEARQLIVHGHISINGVRVRSPGYLVPRNLEDGIGFAPTSRIVKAKVTQQVNQGGQAVNQ